MHVNCRQLTTASTGNSRMERVAVAFLMGIIRKNKVYIIMKREYEKMCVTPLGIVSEGTLLDGSVTDKHIAISNTVTVEDFTYGFSTDSEGKTDAGFDVTFD